MVIRTFIQAILLFFVSLNTYAQQNNTTGNFPPTGRFAYVNIDTLEAKYELLNIKREEFSKHKEEMENELKVSYSEMEKYANEMQQKTQANTITQPEYEAGQKHLADMQQNYETRKQFLTQQLVKEQDDFNEDLKKRLDQFLEAYNKDKHYDFIFSYSSATSTVLLVNKALDITPDVVAGMNAASKNEVEKR